MDRPNTTLCVNCKRPVILLNEQVAPSLCLLCQQKSRERIQKNKTNPTHIRAIQKCSVNIPKDNMQKISIPILETKEQIDAWISERKMNYKSKILYSSKEDNKIKKTNTSTFEQYSENTQKSRNRKSNDSVKKQKISLYENIDEPTYNQQQHDNIYSRWNDIPSAHSILLSMIRYIVSKHNKDI